MRRGEQPWRTVRSRALRENQTSAEAKLWVSLHNRQLDGHKFDRQLPVGEYFADFGCREAGVVVEIDGVTHVTPSEITEDARRTAALQAAGNRVFKVSNCDVYENCDGVLDSLLEFLNSDQPPGAALHPNPLVSREVARGEGVHTP